MGQVRDAAGLVVPRVGRVVETSDQQIPYRVVDAAGEELRAVSEFLRDIAACVVSGRPRGGPAMPPTNDCAHRPPLVVAGRRRWRLANWRYSRCPTRPTCGVSACSLG